MKRLRAVTSLTRKPMDARLATADEAAARLSEAALAAAAAAVDEAAPAEAAVEDAGWTTGCSMNQNDTRAAGLALD
jgi:hypothetical protein